MISFLKDYSWMSRSEHFLNYWYLLLNFIPKSLFMLSTKNLKTDIFPSLTCFLILNGITFWRVYIVSVQCRGSISIRLDRFHNICIIRLWKSLIFYILFIRLFLCHLLFELLNFLSSLYFGLKYVPSILTLIIF